MSLSIAEIIEILQPDHVLGCREDDLSKHIGELSYHQEEFKKGQAFVNFKNELLQ